MYASKSLQYVSNIFVFTTLDFMKLIGNFPSIAFSKPTYAMANGSAEQHLIGICYRSVGLTRFHTLHGCDKQIPVSPTLSEAGSSLFD